MATIYDNDMDLIVAAGVGDLELVRQLLLAGADPNCKDVIHRGTALQAAAAKGHLDVVKLLAESGADLNMEAGDVMETAIEVAAIAGQTKTVEWLLKANARVPHGRKAQLLEDLKRFGELQIIEMLEKGAV